MSRRKRRARQQVPPSAHAVPEAAPGDLLAQANKIARYARSQGFQATVECGDQRTPYKPHILIEIWQKKPLDGA